MTNRIEWKPGDSPVLPVAVSATADPDAVDLEYEVE